MPGAFTGTASSTTSQMEKMLRVFSPLYEACGLKISGPPALSDCNVMITGIDVGLIASGCARWLTGVGLTATFAVGLALVRVARRGGAFFAAFFLITSFSNRLSAPCRLGDGRFLAFRLGSSFCRHGNLPDAHCIWKVFVRSLPVNRPEGRDRLTIDRRKASKAGEAARKAKRRCAS